MSVSGGISLYIFSLCLSIFYNFSCITKNWEQEMWGDRRRGCSLGLRCAVSGPALTVAKVVKASGSSTRSSLFSVPSTKHDTASSSARFFFKVVMVVMTVCRRTPRVSPDPHTPFPPFPPKTPQEGKKRVKQEEEYQRGKRFMYKGVYCNKHNFLTKEDCLSQL